MKKLCISALTISALLLSAAPASAAKVKMGKEGELNVYGYIQPRFDANFDDLDRAFRAADKYDFSIQRIRLLFKGKLSKHWRFFVGTLTNNYGRNGNNNIDAFIGDAMFEFFLNRQFRVNVGLLRPAFSRHSLFSGAKLNTIHQHSFFIKRAVADQQTKFIPFRDMGIQIRGLLFNDRIDYRLAITDGLEPGGGADNPRFTGRIGYNFFDAEPEYLLANNYLGKRKVLTVGFSYDVQAGVGIPDEGVYHPEKDIYWALAGDVHADIPFGKQSVVADLSFYYYGKKLVLDPDLKSATPSGMIPQPKGWGLVGELGYRYKKFNPLVSMEYFMPDNKDDSDKGKRMTLLYGFNYWIKGYKINLKAQFGMSKIWKTAAEPDWAKIFTLQSQFLFK